MKEQDAIEIVRRINTFNALTSLGLCFAVLILGIAIMPFSLLGWFGVILGVMLEGVALYTLLLGEKFLAPKNERIK